MFWLQFKAIFRKNVLILKRNWTGLCFEVIISIFCIAALVIYRNIQNKVFIPERSYLEFEQIPLYPSLAMLYSDTYFSTIKNLSIKYNLSFPYENVTAFKEVFFLNGTNMINISSLDNSTLPFGAYGINANDLSTLINSNNIIPNTTAENSSSNNLLGNETMDESDQMQIFNLAENITQINHMKNCLNPYFGGYVGLSPRNNITDKIANLLATIFFKSLYFENNEEINQYIRSSDYNEAKVPRICFAVVFEKPSNNESGYSYSLRFTEANPIHEVYETDQPWRTHPFRKEWLDKYNNYAKYGFIVMQMFIDNIIIQEQLNNSEINITSYISSVMTPDYYFDDLLSQLEGRSNIFVILSYIFPFLKLIHYIMYEKEKRIKEAMKMMGICEIAFYLSWFCLYFLIFLILSLINSLLLNIFMFTFSSFAFIFLIQFLYTISIMFHGLLITVFFSRSKTAVVAGVFLLFIEFLFVQIVQKNNVAFSTKTLASLSPIITISLSFDLFLQWEETEQGVVLNTISILYNNYNITTAIIFFLVSSVIFFLLFLYFNLVFPNEFGRKKHPLFFLHFCLKREKKYFKVIRNPSLEMKSEKKEEIALSVQENEPLKEVNFEKVGINLLDQKTFEIKNLTKIFSNGKRAVDNLNITMYENQIFVLLGVNGAGKTTTFSMLTGLIPQTSGSVNYFSYNMDVDMKKIQKIMGVCPQFDFLFDNLTVKEHLDIYATLKGMPKNEINLCVSKMLGELKLEEKQNYLSKTLSGGQKRKLSVGIAFIGGSKLIFLDEPTTGMDPTNRRVIWDLLKKNKKGKVIVLTTHFMDEAEYLGDRIGIMGEGVLKCCGSDVFLKNLYGIGYNLTIVKQNSEENSSLCQEIQGIIKSCRLLSETSFTLVFQLPIKEIDKFKQLCEMLEANKEKYKINSYGVSITSLEEVFLKVAQNRVVFKNDEEFNIIKSPGNELKNINSDFLLSEIRITKNKELYFEQFKALFMKRIYYIKKDWRSVFFEILLPVSIMLLGIALLYGIPIGDPPSLKILPKSLYNSDFKVLYSGIEIGELMKYTDFSENTSYFDSEGISKLSSKFWDKETFNKRFQEQKGSIFVSDFNKSPTNTTLNMTYLILTNTTSPDSGPMFINQVNKAVIRYLLKDPNFRLDVTNYPLAYSDLDKENEFLEYQFFVALIFTLAFAFIPSSLVVFFVKERESKMKHEQVISGMKTWIYWLTNFIFDFPKSFLPIIITMIIVKEFEVRGLASNECWGALWLLFFLYTINIIPVTYLTSFFFEEHGYAQTVCFIIHLMMSSTLTLVFGLMRILVGSREAAFYLSLLFRLIPSFAFGYGTFNIANRRVYAYIDLYYEPKSAFDLDIAGMDMLYLGVTAFLVWFLVIFLEISNDGDRIKNYFTNKKIRESLGKQDMNTKNLENDVIKEKEKLMNPSGNELLLKVCDLKKLFYGGHNDKKNVKIAVDSLCLGINKAECFCLLGVNGAGKTTTFRMLTGEIKPDEGSIFIGGNDAILQPWKIKHLIGYCPQNDPLLDILSVEEHLYLFAGIKGIPSNLKGKLVEEKMKSLELLDYRRISSCKLSGGNKRKLSFAIATLGNPSVIFLDEPSSGMDPKTRRFLWDSISKFSSKNSKKCVILTTHLMEEAEVLATRIGIMVEGSLKCIGNTQYLKNKFGKGYEVEIMLELPNFQDMNSFAQECNCTITDSLKIDEIKKILEKNGLQTFVDDFKNKCLTGHLFINQMMKFEALAEYIITERRGKRILDFFNTSIGNCEIIEHFNNFFRLKLDSEKQISFFFGELENKKNDLRIKYYSLKQNTIEQIFNKFALKKTEENKDQKENN